MAAKFLLLVVYDSDARLFANPSGLKGIMFCVMYSSQFHIGCQTNELTYEPTQRHWYTYVFMGLSLRYSTLKMSLTSFLL